MNTLIDKYLRPFRRHIPIGIYGSWVRVPLLAPALVFLVTLAAFAPSITNGHLGLDDWGYVTFGNGGIFMPLTSLTYWLDNVLLGGSWPSHHAVNVVLHALNAVLVYELIRGFLKKEQGAGSKEQVWWLVPVLCALVWSLHPQRVEAVTWVASRKEELWSLFALCALLIHPHRGWWGSTLLVLLACLAKPSAVCLPFLLLLEDVYLSAPGTRHQAPGTRHLLPYLPMLAIALVTGLVAVWYQRTPAAGVEVAIFDVPFWWRCLNGAVSLGLDLFHTLVPVGLHLDYRAVIGGWPLQGALGLCALCLVLGAAFLVSRGRLLQDRPFSKGGAEDTAPSGILLALLFYVLAIAPVLGVIGFTGDKAYADRYTYLPAVALSLLLASALHKAPGTRHQAHYFCALCLVLGALCGVTIPLERSYRDDVAAYTRVLSLDPDHWRALRVLGSDLCTRPDTTDQGLAMLRRSLALRPSFRTQSALAYVLACRGTAADDAEVARLGAAIAADPARDREGLMLDALGLVALRAPGTRHQAPGTPAPAVRYLSAALLAPERSHANDYTMLNLGYALSNDGRPGEALKVLSKLTGVSDSSIRSHARAALVQIRAGRAPRYRPYLGETPRP